MHLVSPADTVCAGTPLAPAKGLSSIHRPLLATHPPNPLSSSAPVCANASDQLCHRSVLLHCIVSNVKSTDTFYPKLLHPETSPQGCTDLQSLVKRLDHLEHVFCDGFWQMFPVIC